MTRATIVWLYVAVSVLILGTLYLIYKYYLSFNYEANYMAANNLDIVNDDKSVKNAYPEKPVVKYQKTTINQGDAFAYIKATSYTEEVKKGAAIIAVNESSWFKSCINNNCGGIQADAGRWNAKYDSAIVATTIVVDGEGKRRRFCVFANWKTGLDMVLSKTAQRGLYIGGTTNYITKMNVADLATFNRVYYKEWVRGDASAEPNAAQSSNFETLYNKISGLV